MIIDKNLSFNPHIEKIRSKVSSGLFALHSVKNILPAHHLKLIYHSLIASHLNYGIIFWGNAPKKHTNKILVLQKKAVRTISSATY